jgi:CheY-like chemotaxis protein
MHCKVLIVDDEPDVLATAKRLIKQACDDATIVTEDNARSALSHIEDGNIDVLITDVGTGDRAISGYDLAEEAKKRGCFTVAFSGCDLDPAKARLFDYILAKPPKDSDLLALKNEIINWLPFGSKVVARYVLITKRVRRS